MRIKSAEAIPTSVEENQKNNISSHTEIAVSVRDSFGEEHYLFKEDTKGTLKAISQTVVEKDENWIQSATRKANEKLFLLLKPILKGNKKEIDPDYFLPTLSGLDPALRFYIDENGDRQNLTLLPTVKETDIQNARVAFQNRSDKSAYATFVFSHGEYKQEELKKITHSLTHLASLCNTLQNTLEKKLHVSISPESVDIERHYQAISTFTQTTQFHFIPEKVVLEAINQWRKNDTENPVIESYSKLAFSMEDCKILQDFILPTLSDLQKITDLDFSEVNKGYRPLSQTKLTGGTNKKDEEKNEEGITSRRGPSPSLVR